MSENEPELPQESVDSESFERHRPFLRMLDKQFGTIYGFGGTLILVVAFGLPGLVGWKFHLFHAPILYIASILLFLFGFSFLRAVVRIKRTTLRESYYSYCEANELDPLALAAEIKEDDTYSFVTALVEKTAAERYSEKQSQESSIEKDAE